MQSWNTHAQLASALATYTHTQEPCAVAAKQPALQPKLSALWLDFNTQPTIIICRDGYHIGCRLGYAAPQPFSRALMHASASVRWRCTGILRHDRGQRKHRACGDHGSRAVPVFLHCAGGALDLLVWRGLAAGLLAEGAAHCLQRQHWRCVLHFTCNGNIGGGC